jgi:cystathionine beta-lyase/cystathionine gamma-synthase
MGFSTDAIHAGQHPDLATGAVITPVYLTSTYAQEELGVHKGYEYGRTHNLTRSALEKNIAVLEKGKTGIAFSSGIAAIHAIMGLIKSGDHVIVTDSVYGGTYRLFELIMTQYGIEFSWVDTRNIDNLKNAIKSNSKLVYIETPTNPMLTLTDLREVALICKENNLLSIVDNTFMSPFFQNPIEYGIDIVVHSSTKYLNGHSDIIGGIIITNDEQTENKLRYTQNSLGAVPSPFDCWLTLRSTKTLAVRMERHEFNAKQIASFLEHHTSVESVIYPGLTSHQQHELAAKQMRGFSGIVSFKLNNFDSVKSFMKKLRVFTLAESLGGVESLVCHPVTMTHASVPKEKRESFGLTENLIRLSVGIEDIEDLLDDLNSALK